MNALNQFAHPEYAAVLILVALLLALLLVNRLPDVQGCIDLINVLNTKGGNILVLTMLSVIFFFAGVHFLYFVVNKIIEGKLTAADAIVGMGFQWLSGSAFGLTIGALLKTMSGEEMTSALKPGTTETTTEKKTIIPEAPVAGV